LVGDKLWEEVPLIPKTNRIISNQNQQLILKLYYSFFFYYDDYDGYDDYDNERIIVIGNNTSKLSNSLFFLR